MRNIDRSFVDETVQKSATEDDLQKAVSDACDFIIRLKKSGLNIILPDDQDQCRDRFELLVNLLMTEKGFPGDRPDWLTDQMMQSAAYTIGARIYSMQPHLAEPSLRDRMKAVINETQAMP